MKKQTFLKLLFSLLICQLAGIIGSIFTAPAIATWYTHLNRPSFTPPSWLFGPVWIILYVLMGLALFLIWKRDDKKSNKAVDFFLIHLAVNALWSVLFFGLKSPYLALLDIIILWLMIIMLIAWFLQLKKAAAWLLIPYLLWVSFALLLNYNIWILN